MNLEETANLPLKMLWSDQANWALEKTSAMLCGGALTSAFSGQPIQDYDFYFRSKADLADFFGYATSDWGCVYVGHTEKSFTLKDQSNNTIQLICFEYFDSPEAVFDAFDFTVCMAALDFTDYDGSNKPAFVADPRFLLDVAARKLVFHRGTRYPWVSLLRADKYVERGYSLSRGGRLQIAYACSQKQINSWEDAKEQLGGVYGNNIDLAAAGEFTPEAFYESISVVNPELTSSTWCDYSAACKLLGIEEKVSSGEFAIEW